jgi:hypothetical protein
VVTGGGIIAGGPSPPRTVVTTNSLQYRETTMTIENRCSRGSSAETVP